MPSSCVRGRRWTLAPANHPILPGATREIPLYPMSEADGSLPALAYPLQLQGRLEWGKQRIAVPATVGR